VGELPESIRRELREGRSMRVAFVVLLFEAAVLLMWCATNERPGELSASDWVFVIGSAWLLMIPLLIIPAIAAWAAGRLFDWRRTD
jgi:hypothetical protein